MAEIPIQRKEGRNIWPWIIGLLVVLLVLWFAFGRNRNATPVTTATPDSAATTTTTTTAPAATPHTP